MVHTKDILKGTHIPLPLVFLGNDRAQISYRGNFITLAYNVAWNAQITKSSLHFLISYINSYFPSFIFFFYFFVIVLVPLLFIVWAMVCILLASVLTFVLLYTFIPHIHLKKCIQAGMHGTHIPLFVTVLLASLFPTSANILIIGVALIFVFTLVATYEMYSEEVYQIKGR